MVAPAESPGRVDDPGLRLGADVRCSASMVAAKGSSSLDMLCRVDGFFHANIFFASTQFKAVIFDLHRAVDQVLPW